MRIGRYEVGRLLGRGGEGAVHEAELRGPGGLRKAVALKLLSGGGRGLVREARIGGLLRHPHLVDVFEVGEHDGGWFLALELCDGGSLARHAPLPPRAVVEVGLQVCEALAYAHDELGLVHLDLKPENLLVHQGVVKVADLGIARARGFEGDTPRGTPGFMAPEQARGEVVDRRADVYALGRTLHVLATGRRTAAAQTFDALDDDAALVVDDALPWLEDVLAGCLALHPEERFPSMEEVARALSAARVTGPGLRAAVGWVPPAPPPSPSTDLSPDEAPFVGREALEQALADHLARAGVTTLKGPGGIGKTRLARRVAYAHHVRTGAEAWFVDLADARTAEDLVRSVARALGLHTPQASSEAAAEQVGRAAAQRGALVVVLDNFEQIVGSAPVVAGWAALAPDARWLVTSREPLRIAGERVMEIGPLSAAEAVALLRARALLRGVDLADDDALRELAARLDGVPLALELAAGRLGVLDVAEVLERLGPSLLRSGDAGVADRQRTLAATIAWSFELLDPGQRAALAGLATFHAPFTAEAAEAVLGVPAVLDMLDALADRSLLSSRDGRFGLYETIRSAAAALPADRLALERRHGAWFGRLNDPELLASLDRPEGVALRRELAIELPDLVRAVRAAIARGEPRAALNAATAASEVFAYAGPYDAWSELTHELVAAIDPPRRAAALALMGRALQLSGRLVEARAALDEAASLTSAAEDRWLHCSVAQIATGVDQGLGDVARARERSRAVIEVGRVRGELRIEATAWANLGVAEHAFHPEEARAAYERAIEGFRACGFARAEGVTLGNLGNLHREHGRIEEARACYERALDAHRAFGNARSEAIVLGNLALLHLDAGRLGASEDCFDRAVGRLRAIGDLQHLQNVLMNRGSLLRDRGRLDEAEASWNEALALATGMRSRHGEGTVLTNLGALANQRGRTAEAREALARAWERFDVLGNTLWLGFVGGELGMAALREGRPSEALAALDVAVARLLEKRPPLAVPFLVARAEARAGVRDLEGSADDLAHAERLAGDDPRLRLGALCARVRIGDPRAVELLAQADALARSLGAAPESPCGADVARARAALAAG